MKRSFERRSCVGGAAILILVLCGFAVAQDPATSSDRPPGNVNELTLAGLRPGSSTVGSAVARFGAHWTHPSADEKDLYVWCDAAQGVRLSLEANPSGTIQVVTVNRLLGAAPKACADRLPPSFARTGRGVRLGNSPQQLKHVYGKPFFEGPSSWNGQDVQLIVFNFSWAGSDKPQILESSFDSAGRLVKMTLSAEYY